VISEGSCDTEDFSNDAENSALHHRNKLHFKYIKTENRFTFFTIFINITVVYCIFYQINVMLKSIDFMFLVCEG